MHSKKSEYYVVLGCNVLYISMRSTWTSMSFKALVSLLIFCLGDLSVAESIVLRSPTINVIIYTCLYSGYELACVSGCSPVGGIGIYNCRIHLLDTSFENNIVSLCISNYSL